MTTDNMTNTVNKVIVVGMLDTMLVRDRGDRSDKRDRRAGRDQMIEVTRKAGRTRGIGGRWENLTLQVRSPYGGMFAMPIEIEPNVPGAELLAGATADTMLAIEGALQLKQSFDPRFATDRTDFRGRTDRGRPSRELQLLVSCVREPNEHERRASSAVWLEGEVAEPPQISRHPELPSIQLAGTILRVSFGRPADFPGIAATIQETVDVNIAIPTSHHDAEKLYRQGNVVRVVGQLDCRMEYQGGEAVRLKLAAIDAEWAERKAELAGKPGELRRAETAYLRVRQRFEAAPRLYVLTGCAELLAGEVTGIEATYQARRDFVRSRRQQQDARRTRTLAERAGRAGVTVELPAPDSSTDMPVRAVVPAVDIDGTASTSRPGRPRRRVDEVAIADATPIAITDGEDHIDTA
jgi:hypothetical protein